MEPLRIKELDSFRGIACLSIVLFHYLMYFYNNPSSPAELIGLIGLLQYGVHFFFIISGFVIFMALEKTKQPVQFIVNRFSRLFPAYWICLILTTLVVNYSPYYDYHLVTSNRFLINLTMLQHWFMIEDVDGSYWSLAVELCFYTLIFIVFAFNKGNNINLFGIFMLSGIVLVLILIKTGFLAQRIYYYVPLLRFGTLFFAGILFYQAFKTGYSKMIVFYLTACLIVHYFLSPASEIIMVLFFCLLMHLFVIKKLQFLQNDVLLFLGSISYPLFLIHQYAGYELLHFLKHHSVEKPLPAILISISVMILISKIISTFVEKPALSLIRKRFLKKNFSTVRVPNFTPTS